MKITTNQEKYKNLQSFLPVISDVCKEMKEALLCACGTKEKKLIRRHYLSRLRSLIAVLPSQFRQVLDFISYNVRKYGVSYVSQSRIADYLGSYRQWANYLIGLLKETGLLQSARRYNDTCIYTIPFVIIYLLYGVPTNTLETTSRSITRTSSSLDSLFISYISFSPPSFLPMSRQKEISYEERNRFIKKEGLRMSDYEVKSMKLTDTGRARLASFSQTAVIYADSVLSKQRGRIEDRFGYFIRICINYSRDNNLVIDWDKFNAFPVGDFSTHPLTPDQPSLPLSVPRHINNHKGERSSPVGYTYAPFNRDQVTVKGKISPSVMAYIEKANAATYDVNHPRFKEYFCMIEEADERARLQGKTRRDKLNIEINTDEFLAPALLNTKKEEPIAKKSSPSLDEINISMVEEDDIYIEIDPVIYL